MCVVYLFIGSKISVNDPLNLLESIRGVLEENRKQQASKNSQTQQTKTTASPSTNTTLNDSKKLKPSSKTAQPEKPAPHPKTTTEGSVGANSKSTESTDADALNDEMDLKKEKKATRNS